MEVKEGQKIENRAEKLLLLQAGRVYEEEGETSARLMRRGQRGVGCRCVACGVVLR